MGGLGGGRIGMGGLRVVQISCVLYCYRYILLGGFWILGDKQAIAVPLFPRSHAVSLTCFCGWKPN